MVGSSSLIEGGGKEDSPQSAVLSGVGITCCCSSAVYSQWDCTWFFRQTTKLCRRCIASTDYLKHKEVPHPNTLEFNKKIFSNRQEKKARKNISTNDSNMSYNVPYIIQSPQYCLITLQFNIILWALLMKQNNPKIWLFRSTLQSACITATSLFHYSQYSAMMVCFIYQFSFTV